MSDATIQRELIDVPSCFNTTMYDYYSLNLVTPARNVSIARVQSSLPKTLLPATITFAPASAAISIVDGANPPST